MVVLAPERKAWATGYRPYTVFYWSALVMARKITDINLSRKPWEPGEFSKDTPNEDLGNETGHMKENIGGSLWRNIVNDYEASTLRIEALNDEMFKVLTKLVRDLKFTKWNTNGARKTDNRTAENIKAHDGKFMDASENLIEENKSGDKTECGGGTREKIGTNEYDKGTYARQRENENPEDAPNSHDYCSNEVDETLGEKDAPVEGPAHPWVICAHKREAITQTQAAADQKRRRRLMKTPQGNTPAENDYTEHNASELQTQAEETDTGATDPEIKVDAAPEDAEIKLIERPGNGHHIERTKIMDHTRQLTVSTNTNAPKRWQSRRRWKLRRRVARDRVGRDRMERADEEAPPPSATRRARPKRGRLKIADAAVPPRVRRRARPKRGRLKMRAVEAEDDDSCQY